MEFEEILGEGRRRVGLHIVLTSFSALGCFIVLRKKLPLLVFHNPQKDEVPAKGNIAALTEMSTDTTVYKYYK